ncbi:aspartate carbamoyltransferase catalytic subunit [soil metagenome]
MSAIPLDHAEGTATTPHAPWRHRDLLDVANLTAAELGQVMTRTADMSRLIMDGRRSDTLTGQQVATLFYEPSTRTRLSFELAARRLSADVVSVSVATSSVTKGESLIDTVRTLEALGARLLVVRHGRSGAPQLVAQHFGGHVVNGGDGWHAHPTQALVDLYTLREALPGERLRGRKVTIVGDILHSRVARSNVWSLTAMGADLWLCGPATLLQCFDAWAAALPAERRLTVTTDLDAALRDADAVMAVRLQAERQSGGLLPSLREYSARYGITAERLKAARPEVVVLHPGPMNEGVEITPDVAAGTRSLVTRQVRHGIAVRMAVMSLVAETGARFPVA